MAGHSTCAPGDDEPCDSLSPHACRPSFGVTNIVVYHGSDPVRRVGGARRRRVPGDDGVRAAHLRIPEAAAVRHWLLVDDSPGGAANHRTCGDDGGGDCHCVLFRHDHGLFLGMGGLLVAALSTKERSVRAVLARLPAASATSPDIRRSMSSMSACCGRSAAKSCPSYWSPVNLPAGSRCAFR